MQFSCHLDDTNYTWSVHDKCVFSSNPMWVMPVLLWQRVPHPQFSTCFCLVAQNVRSLVWECQKSHLCSDQSNVYVLRLSSGLTILKLLSLMISRTLLFPILLYRMCVSKIYSVIEFTWTTTTTKKGVLHLVTLFVTLKKGRLRRNWNI